ncbi:MAG TPA: hypothetical protein EYN60_03490 [Nitrospirales bacterium]|nr:hypothetical protein [Nitrospirales bacterium]
MRHFSCHPMRASHHCLFWLLSACMIVGGLIATEHTFAQPTADTAIPLAGEAITLDFQEVELPVFIRFISEFTGKNIMIDEAVRGKVSLFSPAKVSSDGVYQVFLDVLKLKGFIAVEAGEVIQVLSAADAPSGRQIHVHKLKNARAADITAVLVGLVSRSNAVTPPQPGKPIVRRAAEFEGPVQIYPDKASNSLIITATPVDYRRLVSIIDGLDVRLGQVFVEAVIMEVSLATLKEIGNEPSSLLATTGGNLTTLGGFNQSPENIVGIASLLAGQLSAGIEDLTPVTIRNFLHALLTRKDVNLLSTPQILAADNHKAKIIVGENRPFVTGQSQSVGGNTLTTIDREDVGVTLELTPHIMADGMIRLEVSQEITAVDETIAQNIGDTPVGPTTTKRGTSTTVIVHDGDPIVLGGLIRDNVTVSERKIPLLGDIPFLGAMFRFETRSSEKINLLIFLTPHIVRDPEDLAKIREEKVEDMQPFLDDTRIEDSQLPNAVQQLRIVPSGEVINHSFSFRLTPIVSSSPGA